MKKAIIAMSLALFFVGCGGERPSPLDAVRESYRAMDSEDIDAYLATVTGPRAAAAETLLADFFADYDVAYSIDSIELVSEMGNVAQVRTVVTATDRGGPKKFHDNRMVAVHKLRFEHGKWRIFFSDVERPKMLDAPSDTVKRGTS